jgi:hypothetical protein
VLALGPAWHRLRIAGTAALPAIGGTFSIHPSLSTGAILPIQDVTTASLREDGAESGPNAILIRLCPEVSQAAGPASLQKITRSYDRIAHAPQTVAEAAQRRWSSRPAQCPRSGPPRS